MDVSTVRCILTNKSGEVVTVRESDSVLEAARVMNQHRIGSVVVLRSTGEGIAGILTERDVLTRVVALAKDPRTTRASEVMTSPVYFCSPDTLIDELRDVMKTRRIRHAPAIHDGRLIGMVSIGDLNAFVTGTLTATVETLEAYISRA
jgi:CBS domain-containing protein